MELTPERFAEFLLDLSDLCHKHKVIMHYNESEGGIAVEDADDFHTAQEFSMDPFVFTEIITKSKST
jgi:hypothetical protein